MNTENDRKADRNEDPITGEPGAHPVGVGVGTAGGATAGAAVGAIGGPVGAVVGAAIGGVAGAFAGKAAAEHYDPTVEDTYWRENHQNQQWATPDTSYDDYAPAYHLGHSEAAVRRSKWDANEPDLKAKWSEVKGKSRLEWERARHATRAGWHRVEDRLPGDADNDGH